MDEFELVAQYFSQGRVQAGVRTGIGDDGAVLEGVPGQDIVVVTDTLVAGVHFATEHSAGDIGHKALAVNLSDIAAMGASAGWALLNLTLPRADTVWLENFSGALLELADRFAVALIGGDTTRGPLSISVTVGGWVPSGQALTRQGASTGEDIYISGTLGEAAAALALGLDCQQQLTLLEGELFHRLARPEPRVDLGIVLRTLATAAIDISDGLLADLGHVLAASGQLGASITAEALPLSPAACKLLGKEAALSHALTGGDDFELCFTAPPERRLAVATLARSSGLTLTCIGTVTPGGGVTVSQGGAPHVAVESGYRHHWQADG